MLDQTTVSRLQDMAQAGQYDEIRKTFSGIQNPTEQVEAVISLLSPYTEVSPKRLDIANHLNSVLPEAPSKYISLYCAAAYEGANGNLQKADALMLESLSRLCDAIERDLPLSGVSLSILMHALYMDSDMGRKFQVSDQWKLDRELQCGVRHSADWIFVVSCNGLYFDRFASKYLSSVERVGMNSHVHFQIVQPTEKTRTFLRNFPGTASLSVSADYEMVEVRPVYLICRRFQIAHELLKKYKKPIFITDIDIELKAPVRELLEIPSEQYDVALFEFSNDYPMLTCHCSLVLLQPKEEVVRLLNYFSLYVDRKMEQESGLWMLDQCAMFVLSRLAAAGQLAGVKSLRWRDLKLLTQRPLDDFQAEQAPSEEKHGMRMQVYADFGSYDILSISREVLTERLQAKR
jgi:hypothetical protein